MSSESDGSDEVSETDDEKDVVYEFYQTLGVLCGLAVAFFYLESVGVSTGLIARGWALFIGVALVVTIGGQFLEERVLS